MDHGLKYKCKTMRILKNKRKGLGSCVAALHAYSVMSNSASSWTATLQVPLSIGFSRQKYWSGLPFSPPGNLPDPGARPGSLVSPALAGRFFTTVPPGKP